jgi:hypothetical protein
VMGRASGVVRRDGGRRRRDIFADGTMSRDNARRGEKWSGNKRR